MADLDQVLEHIEHAHSDECWPWRNYIDPQGYGRVSVGGKKAVLAHRWVYEVLVGSIPDGMDVDHLCHNQDRECPGGSSCSHRRCVNPIHLDPTTRGENSRRAARPRPRPAQPTCRNGHSWTAETTQTRVDGRRYCKQCQNAKRRDRRHGS